MATIKDVAKRAGVSTGTVSMVINNNPAVKLETRLRVLQAIEELNYAPNQYARSLVTKRRNIVGVVRTVVTSQKDAYRGGYHFNELPDTSGLGKGRCSSRRGPACHGTGRSCGWSYLGQWFYDGASQAIFNPAAFTGRNRRFPV